MPLTPAQAVVLQLGPFGTPPAILGTLLVIGLVLLVGRLLLKVAWRIVVIAVVVVAALWLLGGLGFALDLL
jgi:hypothetical protein